MDYRHGFSNIRSVLPRKKILDLKVEFSLLFESTKEIFNLSVAELISVTYGYVEQGITSCHLKISVICDLYPFLCN